MSATTYTPEPWSFIDAHDCGPTVYAPDCYPIGHFERGMGKDWIVPNPLGKDVALANGKRACDCVNALAGITDPAAAIQAVKGILTNLYNDTEGYADGAPDASAHDKLCNHVAHHVKAALALLTPKP